jgi:hypothetical protein
MDMKEGSSYLPLVFGPELAMANIPAPVNLNSGCISSSLIQSDAQDVSENARECVWHANLQSLSVNARSTSASAGWVPTLDHEVLQTTIVHEHPYSFETTGAQTEMIRWKTTPL